jgi:plastocyanin
MRRVGLTAAALALTAGVVGAYEAAEVKNGGTIVGVVGYAGPTPAARKLAVTKDQQVCGTDKADDSLLVSQDKLANAVVSITGIVRGKPMGEPSAVLDQKGCQYAPHVLLVPAGSTVKVLNGDGILHNVHTYGRINPPVNIAQPSFKKEVSIQLDEAESLPVKCDTHEWMSGVIVVMEHPYYARTDETGAFRLSDVPPGEHAVKVWHEKLGDKTVKVTVAPGKEARLDVTLGAQ